jgi:5'-methylthioadenosine phosphorylase
MEGPQFSTRAESLLHRQWNTAVIGMTNAQEAKLAREAEVCLATVALATDYDCWHEAEAAVSVEEVIRILRGNIDKAKRLLREAVPRIAAARGGASSSGSGGAGAKIACGCRDALRGAIMTSPAAIPKAARERLDLLIGRHLGAGSHA